MFRTSWILLAIAIGNAWSLSMTESKNWTHPIKLAALEKYIQQMDANDGWKTEFNSLPEPQTQLKPWIYAAGKENIHKHRYPPPDDQLMTYDDTRVILSKNPGEHFSDFINANWVDSTNETKRYIGTQCPIPSTISDFYRMVWQYNVHQVVMLASPHDVEKNKCARYFPDGSTTYGDIEVSLQRKTEFKDVTLRVYALKRGSSVRVFVHNHFVSWPDMGVPNDPKQLLNLIRLYRSSDAYSRSWPLVVHCSAGVGRTGTFLLTDSIYDQASTSDSVDFLKHLWLIRNQRISLVEKPEQYALAHRVILQAYKEGLFDQNKPPRPFNREGIAGSGGLFSCPLTLILCLFYKSIATKFLN